MSTPSAAARVVGLVPWLPWPLSAWRWWTEPLRAERLAAFRIGLAAFLLGDILTTYAPGLFTYFGQESLGDSAIFGWRTGAPRLSWSVLRGPGDSLSSFLALAGWGGATLWIVADLGTRAARGCGPRERDPLRYSLPLWCLAGALLVLGIWSRLAAKEDELAYAWFVALPSLGLAGLFLALEAVRYLRSDGAVDPGARAWLLAACAIAIAQLGAGAHLSTLDRLEPGSSWARLLGPWQDDPALLAAAMAAWVIATLCLLLGLGTRPAAITTWVLSMSFANLNSSIDNAGDTIRGIALFYLMLCPCGAAWSLDRLWRRRRGKDVPVLYVAPWPIRLLFVQLVFIYFCNGVYKLFGGSWREGNSLYYVLGDLTLTRISLAECPLPLWALRAMTWAVLCWEVSFPVLVLNRWTRVVALLFGAAFHLGILVSMELGCFVPYALCLYLPLLPWDRWLDTADRAEPISSAASAPLASAEVPATMHGQMPVRP